jgi:hypothetical protein
VPEGRDVMDNNLVVAIVTSVCTAGSTAGVAITALVLSSKRMDRLEAKMDGRAKDQGNPQGGVDGPLDAGRTEATRRDRVESVEFQIAHVRYIDRSPGLRNRRLQ